MAIGEEQRSIDQGGGLLGHDCLMECPLFALYYNNMVGPTNRRSSEWVESELTTKSNLYK